MLISHQCQVFGGGFQRFDSSSPGFDFLMDESTADEGGDNDSMSGSWRGGINCKFSKVVAFYFKEFTMFLCFLYSKIANKSR